MKTPDELDRDAREILRLNDRGDYTIPTSGLYPYQWNWDSAFAAWGFSTFDPDRAWRELETLMSGQWDNGMVPHILFHKADPGYFPGPDVWGCDGGSVPSSGISQPPVAASVAWRIFRRNPQEGRARAAALFPKLVAWHRWFMQWRQQDGMIFVTHPWESGRDNAPDWDGPMASIEPDGVGEYQRRDTTHVDPHMRPTKYDYDRYIWLVQLGRRLHWSESRLAEANPFRVADPTMTFVLLRANRDLAELGRALGKDTGEIEGWISALEGGVDRLWNEDISSYDAKDLRGDVFAGCVSNASFLCWYGGKADARMADQLCRVLDACTYGVPSHDPASPKFDSRRYWRGPTWAIINTMIGIGLEDAGLGELAARVRDASRELIARHGFAEYFDPLDGTPSGGGTFTWTAAVWLAWISPNARTE